MEISGQSGANVSSAIDGCAVSKIAHEAYVLIYECIVNPVVLSVMVSGQISPSKYGYLYICFIHIYK